MPGGGRTGGVKTGDAIAYAIAAANADESPMWRLSKDLVPLIGAGVMWMFFFAMRAAMRDAAERKAKSAEGSS